jgi:hypothetical protein
MTAALSTDFRLLLIVLDINCPQLPHSARVKRAQEKRLHGVRPVHRHSEPTYGNGLNADEDELRGIVGLRFGAAERCAAEFSATLN